MKRQFYLFAILLTCLLLMTADSFSAIPREKVDQFIHSVVTARQNHTLFKAPTKLIGALNLEQAYDIQMQLDQALIPVLGSVAGYKVAFAAKASQQQFGVNEPAAGSLFLGQRIPAGSELRCSDFVTCIVEAEVAFTIGKKIDAALADVAALRPFVKWVHIGFDIGNDLLSPGSEKANAADAIASGLSSHGFVIGPAHSPEEINLEQLILTLSKDQQVVSAAPATQVMNSPWNSLLWLANHLVKKGRSLQPGDVVLSGTAGPAFKASGCAAGGEFTAEGGSLGHISLRILPPGPDATRLVSPQAFRKILESKSVDLYTLKNKNGMTCQITNYGARIVSLWTPDRNRQFSDVVLGFNSLDEYLHGAASMGAIIGRYANRIAKGRFTLQGKQYSLTLNNGANHIHGGVSGFRFQVWDAEPVNDQLLRLHYFSPDGEEGYPGNLSVTVSYSLTDQNELVIEYQAETDQATVINLTNHAFFNLAGEGEESIANHELQIHASRYTPVDSTQIPTGELCPVSGTVFDFQNSRKIGDYPYGSDRQLDFGKGYDHNFVLQQQNGEPVLAARVYEPESGRVMEVWTSEPGVQFFTANSLSGRDVGKRGRTYAPRYAFCLETQHFADSPNHPDFPSTVLLPGTRFNSITIYKFLAKGSE